MAFTRIGFGQVEPNQLSAQKTGQIYASLPLNKDVQTLQNGEFMWYDYKTGTVTAGWPAHQEGSTSVPEYIPLGEPMLVFNEIKIYEDLLSYKDFAMFRVGDNYVTNPSAIGRITSANADGVIYGDGSTTVGVNPDPVHTEYDYRMTGIAPRVFKTNIGDIFTTNMVKTGSDVTYAVGDTLAPTRVETTVTAADGSTLKYYTLQLQKTSATTGMLWQVAKVYTMPDGQPGLKIQRVQ